MEVLYCCTAGDEKFCVHFKCYWLAVLLKVHQVADCYVALSRI